MNQMAKALALVAVAVACWAAVPMSLADPLHKFGDQGAWRHEDSGWLFPAQIGAFTRVTAPYTIDGNSDVGARYVRVVNERRAAAVVEVYASDSAAPDAKVETAKATAARTAGAAARLESDQAFQLDARNELHGVKVTYTSDAGSNRSQTSLYFIENERWIVKVLAQDAGENAGQALDAFVHDLPWDTLGEPGNLH
jgi:hypothetical protein